MLVVRFGLVFCIIFMCMSFWTYRSRPKDPEDDTVVFLFDVAPCMVMAVLTAVLVWWERRQ